MQQVLEKSKLGQRAQETLKEKFGPRSEEFAKEEQAIRQQQQTLERDKPLMSKDQIKKKEEELKEKIECLPEEPPVPPSRSWPRSSRSLGQAIVGPAQEVGPGPVQGEEDERGLRAQPGRAALTSTSGLDLTKEVIKRMDERTK